MAKKNLPIKLFQKRQKIDDRRVEGGGTSCKKFNKNTLIF